MVISRFAVLALLAAWTLPGAIIDSYSLSYRVNNAAPVTVNAGDGNVSDFGNNFSILGTLGLYDANNDPLANGATINGPIFFRFNNGLFNCSGGCPGATFGFFLSIVTSGLLSPNAGGQFSLDGTGTNASGNGAAYATFGTVLDFISFDNVALGGSFSRSAALPTGFVIGASPWSLSMEFSVATQANGAQIALAEGLEQQVNLDVTQVPEPRSVALVGSILALAWFRRCIAKWTMKDPSHFSSVQ